MPGQAQDYKQIVAAMAGFKQAVWSLMDNSFSEDEIRALLVESQRSYPQYVQSKEELENG